MNMRDFAVTVSFFEQVLEIREKKSTRISPIGGDRLLQYGWSV